MEAITAAGGDGESDDRTLQTTSSVDGERKMESMEKPPDDVVVCPICFENFDVPCRTPCGHWYCGGCILKYWNFSTALQPCRCPLCLLPITKLTPEESLYQRREVEIRKVLRRVDNYNGLYVGGIKGFMQKFLAFLLLYPKRLFCEMLDPDQHNHHVVQMRCIAMIFGAIYASMPHDSFRIAGNWDILIVSGNIAIAVWFGLYLRRRRMRNARE